MSQLDSNDPNYFEDYGTGQRRKVVSQGKEKIKRRNTKLSSFLSCFLARVILFFLQF